MYSLETDEPPGHVNTWWESVVAWAVVRRGGDADDEIIAAMVDHDMPGSLKLLSGMVEQLWLVGVYPDVDRADPEVLEFARTDARKRKAEDRDRQAKIDAIMVFVRQQPEPAAFAAQMRRHATDWDEAWRAITEAKGDPARALQIAEARRRA